jgi:hypothetical protein
VGKSSEDRDRDGKGMRISALRVRRSSEDRTGDGRGITIEEFSSESEVLDLFNSAPLVSSGTVILSINEYLLFSVETFGESPIICESCPQSPQNLAVSGSQAQQ